MIEAENVSMGFDDKILYESLSFRLPRAGIIWGDWSNGAGKTTLFELIMNELDFVRRL